MASAPVSIEAPGRSFGTRLHAGDAVAYTITLIAASSILLVTVLLVYFLWSGSELTRARFGWSFIGGQIWDPVAEKFGALPFAFGTLATSFVALLISGQMLTSLIVDHYGFFNLARHTADPSRIFGAVLLVIGVLLMRP